MSADDGSKLERRVVCAAEAALAERKFVTAIDVLVGVGWLELDRLGLERAPARRTTPPCPTPRTAACEAIASARACGRGGPPPPGHPL